MYTTDDLHAYRNVETSLRPANELASRDIHVVVVPPDRKYLELTSRLAFTDRARWAPVFYDGRSLVLADLQAPETRALVSTVAAGAAHFREESVAALSRALCRASPAVGAGDPDVVPDLVKANLALPTAGGPALLWFTARERHLQPSWLIQSLESGFEALAAPSEGSRGRLGRLQSRLSTAQILAKLYAALGQTPQSNQWTGTARRLAPELESLLNTT